MTFIIFAASERKNAKIVKGVNLSKWIFHVTSYKIAQHFLPFICNISSFHNILQFQNIFVSIKLK